MTFDEILEIGPFVSDKREKSAIFDARISELTGHHRKNCPEYAAMLDTLGFEGGGTYRDIPFLPVRLFKELKLRSVPEDEVVKVLTSSGTTGQAVSRIYLDKKTASDQQKALVRTVSDFTGVGRLPMIIIDSASVIKDRAMFSARGAGILGFSIFGSRRIYALDDDMKLDTAGLTEFLEKNKGRPILLFGFTFMIWQHFYKELMRLKEEGTVFDLSDGILIHGGGWKKLASESVSRDEFHRRLEEVCGLRRIHDYYGMVEQTGSIYMECEHGHLHASIFSDVIMRRAVDFSECAPGEPGIVQVVSVIPGSYPGHSLLTEDEGVLLGEDDCPCGRKGKYFRILGRLRSAEIRGCSDTYADGFRQT
ncbi:MAG: acyl-protein synthetase [Ruminiclostridium sp.]|nr:acyl-protein synthetase [Ruminiclostridium sp.]